METNYNPSKILKIKSQVESLLLKNNISTDDIIVFYNDIYTKIFHFGKITNSNNYFGNIFFAFKVTFSRLDITLLSIFINLISYLRLFFSRFNYLAIYGSDSLDNSNLDFRVSHLISSKSNQIRYLSLVSLGSISRKVFYSNLVRRTQIVFYTDCLSGLVLFYIWFSFIKYLKLKKKSNELYFYFSQNAFVYLTVPLYKLIFSTKKIQKFYCLEINFKNGFSTKIAQENNITTIGFMHGLSFNSYMSHNYLEFLPRKNRWIDEFYVWSDFWKTYYEFNSSVYRNLIVKPFPRYIDHNNVISHYSNTNEQNILWITEPLIDVEEVIDYILLLNKNYKLIFKLRTIHCKFYKSLIKKYPSFIKNEVRVNKLHLSLSNINYVFGTHSTAVLEASLYKIKIGVIYTETWGNFFELEYKDILIDSLPKLELFLKYDYKHEVLNLINFKYFGII